VQQECSPTLLKLYPHFLGYTLVVSSKVENGVPAATFGGCFTTQVKTLHANARPWLQVGTLLGGGNGLAFACTVFTWVKQSMIENSVLRKLLNDNTNNSTK
jgi:hypothetical protein